MIEVSIDNLAMGGRGIGRLDGKAVFIPYTVPGDRVLCRPVREKKRYCEADLVEIIEPSANRVAPVCPVFAECGGCQWQHLPYDAQLEWKERLFREALTRAVPVDAEVFLPITASPQQLGYRCRAQIKCRQTDSGFVAGFRITDEEKADLIAFLHSLTDPEFLTNPRFEDPFHATSCAADCNADGEVAVQELVTAVGIALETAPFSWCVAADAGVDGAVNLNELVRAVNAALIGCW